MDIAYHRDLTRIGGIADHTSASYKLVHYLEDEGITRAAAMDWGIQDVVQEDAPQDRCVYIAQGCVS